MRSLLDELRTRYDTVIVDAPPLLPVTDAALLAAQADGALLVVRHGKTTRDQFGHAIDRLEGVSGRIVGVVLNMVPGRGSKHEYGYGYGYGYGHDGDGAATAAMPGDHVALDDLIGGRAVEPGHARDDDAADRDRKTTPTGFGGRRHRR